MKRYIVLYRQNKTMFPADAPLGFACQADDTDHAEEQCLNAEPDADVVWVYEKLGNKAPSPDDMDRALRNYWTQGMED